MNNPLIAIGPFMFYATAPSFNMLRSTLEPRWAEQDRIGRAPGGQFIGAANPTLDISGVIYPGAFSNDDLIGQMAASANAGDLHNVMGMLPGETLALYAGRWYIRSIQNEKTTFDAFAARKIDFQITLKAYGEDDQSSGGQLFN